MVVIIIRFLKVTCFLGEDNKVVDHLDRCGATTVTDEDVQAIRAANAFAQFRTTIEKESDDEMIPFPAEKKAKPQGSSKTTTTKTIPVCFHVIGKRISRWKLHKNLVALNKAYSGSSCCDTSQSWCVAGTCSPDTGISFAMARLIFKKVRGTTRSPLRLFACVKRNSTEYDMYDETVALEVKKAMHVGDGGQVLNVYFSKLSEITGNATFPSTVLSDKPYFDGVVIHRDAMVGGDSEKVQ